MARLAVLLLALTQVTVCAGLAKDACPGLRSAEEFEKGGNREAAMASYREVLRSDPSCGAGYAGIGRGFYAFGDYVQAAENFEKSLQLRPDDPQLLIWLGRTYLRQMQPDRVFGLVTHAGGSSRTSASVHLLLARAYDAQDKLAEANREIREALKLDPHCPGAHFAAGFMAWTNSDAKIAESEFRQELAVDPHLNVTGYYLAEVLEREGKIADAEAAIAQLGRDATGTYLYLLGRGKLYENKKLFPLAAEQYRQAIEREPQMPEAYYRLAVVLRSQGDMEKAGEEFKKFSELQAHAEGGMGQGMGRMRERIPDFD